MAHVRVEAPNVQYGEDRIEATLHYEHAVCEKSEGRITVRPIRQGVRIRTMLRPHRVGLMLVGWGGNNGTTLTAAVLANRLSVQWETREGTRRADWVGSLTQSSTTRLGQDAEGNEIWAPLRDLVPMVKPDDIVIGGWDISGMDLEAACRRAQVLDVDVQRQLGPHLRQLKPRPSIFDVDFVASNQAERADNVLEGSKAEQVAKLRQDIRDFQQEQGVEKVIVLWTANTERFSEVRPGLNDTADNLLAAIERGESELAPSTLFAVAAILEGCTYINGSPQNTFVPGCLELAEKHGAFVAGDDLKTGQTKLKSVLVDFLVSAGIKPTSIVSYNHLGNNDGKNLSAPTTFRSKEISKSSVVDDMVLSNDVLYKLGEKPDHVVVIKYVPYVGDSKRAMDEYTSEILMGGKHTLVIHNTCEDSLLAAPLLLDLVILAELCSRIDFMGLDEEGSPRGECVPFHPVLSVLSYLVKAPMVPAGAPVINSLYRQRACIENLLRACIGLGPESHIQLEHKLRKPITEL